MTIGIKNNLFHADSENLIFIMSKCARNPSNKKKVKFLFLPTVVSGAFFIRIKRTE